MITQDTSIAIIGGGIGGLVCALAFAQKGARVCVYEQAPEFTEVGAGLQITPNAVRVLAELDLAQFLPRIGVVSDAVVPADAMTGRAVTRFDLTGQSPRYHFVHRAKLVDLLAGACMERGVTLKTGCRVVSATPQGRFTFVDIASGTSAPLTGSADLVVFADGIHSIGRIMIAGASTPFFTGQVAWRAIVKGGMPPEARILMGPGRHIVTYPIGPDQINLVAVQERDDWAQEGWNHADDPANLQAAFSDFAPAVRQLLDNVHATNLWGLFRHDIASRWFSGAVTMLGDAAHPTLPFLAQGANMAIEDGYVLARSCAEAGNIADALNSYQTLRIPRVTRAIAAANANAKNYHLSGLQKHVAHLGLRTVGKVAPNAFMNRLSWLYDHDVTA